MLLFPSHRRRSWATSSRRQRLLLFSTRLSLSLALCVGALCLRSSLAKGGKGQGELLIFRPREKEKRGEGTKRSTTTSTKLPLLPHHLEPKEMFAVHLSLNSSWILRAMPSLANPAPAKPFTFYPLSALSMTSLVADTLLILILRHCYFVIFHITLIQIIIVFFFFLFFLSFSFPLSLYPVHL